MWSSSRFRPADESDWSAITATIGTTSFIGRRRETAEIKELLLSERLVTLTGVGGVGKTRLGLNVAEQVQDQFSDGVCFVEVSSLRDPDLLAHTIAMTLDVPSKSPQGPLADLVEYLRDKELLLVIDNCEHLVTACADVTSTLLKAAPDLRVLTTSRQPLGIMGERVWRVPPLETPGSAGIEPSTGVEYPAVALFAERAMTVLPEFRVTDENRETVAQICRQLDGIPLAIELAAVRLRDIPLGRLLVDIDDRFRLLTTQFDVGFARYRALSTAIGWSYDLCSEGEQLMWRHASVFPDTFDLEAASVVCGDDGLTADEVVELVVGLLDKSILSREERFGRAQYRMLDTIREYGQDKLRASGEELSLRRRHRNRCLRLVQEYGAEWFGPDQSQLLAQAQAEHENIRAALDFSLSTEQESRNGLAIAAGLWFYWIGRGFFSEGRYWLDQALRVNHEVGPDRARALWVDAWIASLQGDRSSAAAMAEECLSDARQLQDPVAMAHSTHILGLAALVGDDMMGATRLLPEAIRRLSEVVAEQPDDSDAQSTHALAGVQLAAALSFRGHAEKAIALSDEYRRLCERHGERWVLSYALFVLALAEWESGRLVDAETHARECLRIKGGFYDLLGTVMSVDLLAWIAASEEEFERAAVLLGAADRMWPLVGQTLFGSRTWNAPHRMSEAHCRHHLGEHAYEAAHRRGGSLALAQVVAYASA